MRNTNSLWNSIDWVTTTLYVVLTFIGWVTIYAATINESNTLIFSLNQQYGKQFLWIILAFVTAITIIFIDGTFFKYFSYVIYSVSIFSLVLVLIIGVSVHNATSWFEIGSVKIQPAEFAKVATALALAKLLSGINVSLNDFKTKFYSALLILAPVLLIILQNDTGSALAYGSFILVLYREGISGLILLLLFFLVVLFILALLFPIVNIIITLFGIAILIYSLSHYNYKSAFINLLSYVSILALFLAFDLSTTSFLYIIIIILLSLILFIFFSNSIKKKLSRLILPLIFILSCGFIFTINFAFNNLLQEHQRTRITVLLGAEDNLIEKIEHLGNSLNTTKTESRKKALQKDIKETKQSLKDLQSGALWNINQSLIAFSGGRVTGKGFLKGTQTKFNFVPEQSTDFIFCTIGEEWGFLGTTTVILLYLGLFLRIIYIAERQKLVFSRVYGYCVASILFFNFLINIGMTIGLAPVIGVPLPLISYGGSSLWGFTILIFILIKLDAERQDVMG